jgi:hypothetical protein
MNIRLRRSIVVGGNDRVSVLRGLPPVGIAWINTLVHGHHGWLTHIVIDGRLHDWGFLVVRGIVVRRTGVRHVHTGWPHLVVVNGAHVLHVRRHVGVTIVARVHLAKENILIG